MISTGVAADSVRGMQSELLALVKSFRRELFRYADDTFPSSHADTAVEVLVQAFRVQSQLQELVLRLLASPAIAACQARTDTTDVSRWLSAHLRVERRAANVMVRTAARLDQDLPATRAALAAGAVAPGHADQVAAVVEGYPAGVRAEAMPLIEGKLLSVAKACPPSAVRANGDGALEEADPEAYDRKLQRELADQDARARRDRHQRFRSAGPGQTRVTGVFPTAEIQALRTAIDAFGKPDSPASIGSNADIRTDAGTRTNDETRTDGDSDDQGWAPRTPSQRRADALAQLGDWFLSEGPTPGRHAHGGTASKVVITVTWESLRTGEGFGVLLGTGEQLPISTIEQFLCTSQIAYAKLGTESELTDSRRFFTGKLRELLEIRDRGCAFPGCTTAAAFCDGHHIRAYSRGGPTVLDNGVLLCRYHHGVIHHSAWESGTTTPSRSLNSFRQRNSTPTARRSTTTATAADGSGHAGTETMRPRPTSRDG